MEENISNALLMAAAMIIFVIAVTVTFSLISQTKSTADTVLFSYDDTKYYEEGYENITFTLANENDLDRVVNMETIMPTVYRYIKEHYGVTIMKKNGEIIARFDETTESIVNNWENYLRDARRNPTDSRCQKHYEYLENLAIAAGKKVEGLENGFKSKYNGYDSLTGLWEKIYPLTKTAGNTRIKYGTPWLGDEGKVAERLNADFGGTKATYTGSGIHNGNELNLLNDYKANTFKEIYVYFLGDSGTVTDEETGDSVITKASTKKLEIIYVMED